MTATVSEPVPEGGQASNASSGPEMAEPEADLGPTGAILESVLTRNNLSTEEVTSMSAMHADICPHMQVATGIGQHAQRAAALAQAMAYNAQAGYAEASEQGEAGAEAAAAWAAAAARGAAADEMATQAAEVATEASQQAAEMAETTTDLASTPTGSNVHSTETTPM